jgi:hypothetical protein
MDKLFRRKGRPEQVLPQDSESYEALELDESDLASPLPGPQQDSKPVKFSLFSDMGDPSGTVLTGNNMSEQINTLEEVDLSSIRILSGPIMSPKLI